MKLKTFARRAAAAGAVLAALTLAALPALAAPKVQVSTTNAVADHADILSDETEQYVNDVSIKLSDACGAQIGVYTLDELLGSTTMEGFAYDVFNAWGLGSDDLDNGVLLLLAPKRGRRRRLLHHARRRAGKPAVVQHAGVAAGRVHGTLLGQR